MTLQEMCETMLMMRPCHVGTETKEIKPSNSNIQGVLQIYWSTHHGIQCYVRERLT